MLWGQGAALCKANVCLVPEDRMLCGIEILRLDVSAQIYRLDWGLSRSGRMGEDWNFENDCA